MTDPQSLIDALLAAGWQVVGERQRLYKRLAVVGPSGAKSHVILVPLNGYPEEMESLLNAGVDYLRRVAADGLAATRALDRIESGVKR